MITGLLVAIVILLVEIALKKRGGTIIERVEKVIDKMTRQKGEVIFPQEELAESISKKIKKADERGEDIKLEEL